MLVIVRLDSPKVLPQFPLRNDAFNARESAPREAIITLPCVTIP